MNGRANSGSVFDRPAPGGCRNGGEGGIRTHGGREPTAVFKTAALNHSATCPAAALAAPPLGRKGGGRRGCGAIRATVAPNRVFMVPAPVASEAWRRVCDAFGV